MNIEEVRRYVESFRAPKTIREAKWRELSRWLIGYRGIFGHIHTRKEEDLLLFRASASGACLRAASGMTSGMTPRNVSWFKPVFNEEQLLEASGARAWLDRLDLKMKDCLARGGFYQAIQSFNLDLIWAGCALLYSERANLELLRFECCQIGTFQVALDQEKKLYAVSRDLVMTPVAMAESFGKDALSEDCKKKLVKAPYDEIRITHLVKREEKGHFPYASYFYEEGGKDFLRKSGFYEMPYFFTSWHEGLMPYGTGPGDECLADAKQIDQLERRKLAALGKLSDPPVLIDNPNLKDELDLGPGGINYVASGKPIIPIFDLGPTSQSLMPLQAEIEKVHKRLHDGLMATIFETMPLEQRPRDMSATEFLERKREAMQLLGPVISAYEPNVLTPILERVANSLDRAGLLPILPKSLEGLPILMKMDFISPMANALRQSSAETTRGIIQEVCTIAQASQNPEVLDKVDFDQAVDELAQGLGAPGSIIRADDDVAKIRQQRLEQQAKQQQMLEAQQALNLTQQAQNIAQTTQLMQE